MRREKQAFLAAIAAAALTMSALAPAQDGGGYFGASIGPSKAKHWCSTDDLPPGAALATDDLPPGAALASCDRRDQGWKMFAGYRVIRVLAFEASFIEFGNRSLTATLGPASTTVTARASALSAAAVGIIPLGPLEVFGKAGIAKVKAQSRDVSLSGTTFKLGKNDNEVPRAQLSLEQRVGCAR